MFRLVSILIGYAFGMFQTSYIIGKLSGIDIREHGSKSAGFTNTNRVLGFKKGAVVFVIDVIKAMLAYWIVTAIIPSHFPPETWAVLPEGRTHLGFINAGGTFFISNHILPGLYAGVGAILGHAFPFYIKFKGGKSVACLLGLIIMLDWRVMAISFAIGLIAVCATRFISLASLLISLSVPILLFAFSYPLESVVISAGICALIWFLHRANIYRLVKVEENKFSFKSSGSNLK